MTDEAEVDQLRAQLHDRDVLLLRAASALDASAVALRAGGAVGPELALSELVARAIRAKVRKDGLPH